MDTLNQPSQFSRLDMAFARFFANRSSVPKAQQANLINLLSRLSWQQSAGHNCLELNHSEQQLILNSGLCNAQQPSPLKLEQQRLYLQRYWLYEQNLATRINSLLACKHSNQIDQARINRYFIELIDETDWQRLAAIKALQQSFTLITGGPGTGKTTTVVKILALLQEQSQPQFLHIALAAPTGKAAMRLQESIGQSKKHLPCAEKIKQHIPVTVSTIHRLLGAQPPSPYFKHQATNPLAHDLIVIDEASMIDLALMSKLLDALKPGARLILLGDKDQLASVESGAVLADLSSSLPQHTVELKKSHRFQGAIKQLAEAVNNQSLEKAWQILNHSDQVSLLDTDLIDFIARAYSPYLSTIQQEADFITAFNAFSGFQVLCSNRQGEHGVSGINQQLESHLQKLKKLQLSGQWYRGRPVMITENNSALHLYNGDIGLCLYDQEQKKLLVYFLRPDGSVKKILPSRVPKHETAYAMSIHKSQGSEFEHCLCVLPQQVNPVLSKELIYTAITRAKKQLTMFCDYTVFKHTLEKRISRSGGLAEKLVIIDQKSSPADS